MPIITRLFLDDYRIPMDCAKYMYTRLGHDNYGHKNFEYLKDWVIVRNYPEFVAWITKNGLPDLISFDHDLADGHYHKNMQEGILNYNTEDFNDDYNKTGFHCAKWLVDYCCDHRIPSPRFFVHSMNPVGTENIQSLLDNFNKSIE